MALHFRALLLLLLQIEKREITFKTHRNVESADEIKTYTHGLMWMNKFMDQLRTTDSYAKSNSDSSCNSDGSDCGYTDSVSMISSDSHSICTGEYTRVHEENTINVMSSMTTFNSRSFNESAFREYPGGVHHPGTDERDESVSDVSILEFGAHEGTGKNQSLHKSETNLNLMAGNFRHDCYTISFLWRTIFTLFIILLLIPLGEPGGPSAKGRDLSGGRDDESKYKKCRVGGNISIWMRKKNLNSKKMLIEVVQLLKKVRARDEGRYVNL